MFDPVTGKPLVEEPTVPVVPVAVPTPTDVPAVVVEPRHIAPPFTLPSPKKYALKLTGKALFNAIGNGSRIDVVEVA